MVRVYIVDDSQLFVDELTLTMPWHKLGCEVVGSANNAFTAEREIRAMRPELVITDISMPGRDGLTLIEALRDVSETEFILVSAYSRFEYALKAIKLKTEDYFVKPIDDAEFCAAVARVVERIEQRRSKQAVDDSQRDEQANEDYLEAAIRYVDSHFDQPLTTSIVARQLFVSESALGKQFRRRMNTSFSEYLNYVRIRKAMHLLKTTEKRIYEVSELVGFNDVRYFATLFRKYTGITPRQYKKTMDE